ncbi:acyl-CoA N-acyltransferase [Ramaria rubella]|nr:acyl-CoA N-acyltransferase [Ramaria rubella]
MATPQFCFSLGVLDSARTSLVPFIPSQHAQIFFQASFPHPDLYQYLPFGPFSLLDDFLHWYNSRILSDAAHTTLFAVFDKTRPSQETVVDHRNQGIIASKFPGALAGIVGLLNASPQHASIELGFIIILPEFQHTHVARNAIGLLLHYCLDLPAQGGLGLRRVQWQANSNNIRSIRAAEKMGFVKEGIIRWQRVLPSHKEGKHTREGDPIQGPGRDTALLAICHDDWNTVREKVDILMHQTDV